MALWTEIDPAELTAFTRVAFANLDTGPLATVLPNLLQEEVKFTWSVNEVLDDVAEFGEFDTEAPIGSEGGGEERTMRLLPVSRKVRLSEYEQVTDLDMIRAKAEDKADALVRQIVNRLNRARAEALVFGRLALNENGVKVTANFGRKSALNNATPDNVWGGTSADPVADMRRWFDAVVDASGVAPDVALTSTRGFTALAGRLAAAGYINGGGTVVSRQAVAEVLASHNLPMPQVFDGRVAKERLIPDDRFIYAATGGVSGRTVHAPTVESRDARFNLPAADQPGVVAGVYDEDDPPLKWVMAKTVALPILANPDTTLSAKVF